MKASYEGVEYLATKWINLNGVTREGTGVAKIKAGVPIVNKCPKGVRILTNLAGR
jgi:hypothetical protein